MESFAVPQAEDVAVAVSGGADSMALAALAHEWGKHRVTALTVDHGLRAESAAEAVIAGKELERLGIRHEILSYTGQKPVSNLMAEARSLRYRLLAEYCARHGIGFLLVAHHLEDNAETFLLRLSRGSGVDGLAAMQSSSPLGNGLALLRPLLGVSKERLKATLRERGISWVEDPTNRNLKYKRNALRAGLEALESKELIEKRLGETILSMRRAREALEEVTAEKMAMCVKFEENAARVNFPAFMALHEEFRFRIMADLLMKLGDKDYRPRFESLKTLLSDLSLAPKTRTLGGLLFRFEGDEVVVEGEHDLSG